MTKGLMMYAHNNAQVDYGLIAFCNALMIKHHMKENKICIVTDKGTIDWLITHRGREAVNKAFDHIIIRDHDDYAHNISMRSYRDTLSTSHDLLWYNTDRVDSYSLTPFDQTLLIDCDYMVMDSVLDLVWDSKNEMMINKKALSLDFHPLSSDHIRLETTSIELCWATCVYFRKSQLSKDFFELVHHIKTNYKYYSMVYGFPLMLHRNDYIFSIATHMMNGFCSTGDIASLPSPFLLTSFEKDELINVPNIGEFQFLINDPSQNWKFTVGKTKGISVHVLNKFSINRNAEKIIELYTK